MSNDIAVAVERHDYQAHPAADVFPLMQGAAFAALVDDIRRNGLRDPIVMIGDLILDGRNRLRACREAGVEPSTMQWDGVGSPLDYVVSVNLHRRQLNASQRGMIGARIAIYPHGGDRREQAIRIPFANRADQIAVVLGTSCAQILRAKTILRDGTVAEIAAVEAGAASIAPTVAQIWRRRREPPPEPKVAEVIQLRPQLRRCHVPKMPDGMTAEQVARKAIELHKTVRSVDAVADQLGIRRNRCRMMMDIVLVADRHDLSQQDAALATQALFRMNEGRRRLDQIYTSLKPIMLRLWGNRKGISRDSREAVRADRFEHGLGILIQACLNGTKIEIPHLSPDKARKVLVELHRAVDGVKVLIGKIERLAND